MVSTRSKMPPKGKKEATSAKACKLILNAGKINDGNWDRQGVEEQQVEFRQTSENEYDLVSTALQNLVINEIQSQVPNAPAKILDIVKEAFERFY